MKITFDPEINAAYIHLDEELSKNKVIKTYPCDPLEVGFELKLDFDEMNRLIGIEIHNADKHLSKKLLDNAINI